MKQKERMHLFSSIRVRRQTLIFSLCRGSGGCGSRVSPTPYPLGFQSLWISFPVCSVSSAITIYFTRHIFAVAELFRHVASEV